MDREQEMHYDHESVSDVFFFLMMMKKKKRRKSVDDAEMMET
jgi:hypothetical protein